MRTSRLLLWTAGLLMATPCLGSDRPAIRSAGDLPPTRIALPTPPSTAMWSDAFIRDVVPALRIEAERIRANYDIADPAIATQLRAGLAAIAILERRPTDAAVLVAEARAAATKTQERAMGLLPLDIAAASRMGDGVDCFAGAGRLAALLQSSDPSVIRGEALRRLSQFETTGPAFLAGLAEAEVDPGAGTRGGITLLEGMDLANWRVQAMALPPCRAAYTAAIRTWLADPRNVRHDIWAAREPPPALLEGAKPVTVAVWDGGLDTSLFAGQLAVDPAEPLDGRDNDGNGVVDDWNGPTYGNHLEPTAAPLAPPSPELARQLAFQMTLRKGATDLAQGDDTPEAALFGQRSRDAAQADQAMDAVLWDEVGFRSHGTAVASEIANGAPFVRLYNVSALPFRREPKPVPLDEALIDRWIAAIDRLGPRLRGAGVRIVNISWGLTADEIAASLTAAGLAADEPQAVSRAQAMFRRVDVALRRLVAQSPDVLFVVGAGNSNQADDVFAAIPQSIVAPNLLVVGAAEINGRPTGFTTFGRGVGIYAWGAGVPVRMPGGMRTRGTGTSDAAPLVARAAASMMALRPRLTPGEVVAGLIATASVGEGGIRLLNTGAAVRWAGTR